MLNTDTEKRFSKLCEILAYKIIPLLQEYFYEKWTDIQYVFGDHFDQFKENLKIKPVNNSICNSYRIIQSQTMPSNTLLGVELFDSNDEEFIRYDVNVKLHNDIPIDEQLTMAFKKIYDPLVYKEIAQKIQKTNSQTIVDADGGKE